MSLTSSKSCNKTKSMWHSCTLWLWPRWWSRLCRRRRPWRSERSVLDGQRALWRGERDRKKYCSVYCLRVCNNILQKIHKCNCCKYGTTKLRINDAKAWMSSVPRQTLFIGENGQIQRLWILARFWANWSRFVQMCKAKWLFKRPINGLWVLTVPSLSMGIVLKRQMHAAQACSSNSASKRNLRRQRVLQMTKVISATVNSFDYT